MDSILMIGASGGIGQALSKGLAARGHRLTLHGRDKEILERLRGQLAGEGHELLIGDLSEWMEQPKKVGAIEAVDAIIWSAGICELSPGQLLTAGALRRTLSINLEAPLILCSYFYRSRILNDGGTILFIGSSSAQEAGEGFSVYAASKGGLASASRVLAKEFARRKIRVECLEPGPVNTGMTDKLKHLFEGSENSLTEGMVEVEAVLEEVIKRLERVRAD